MEKSPPQEAKSLLIKFPAFCGSVCHCVMSLVHIFTPHDLLLQDAMVTLPQYIKFKHITLLLTIHHETGDCSKLICLFSCLLYFYLTHNSIAILPDGTLDKRTEYFELDSYYPTNKNNNYTLISIIKYCLYWLIIISFLNKSCHHTTYM
jgi:hypothetical protein